MAGKKHSAAYWFLAETPAGWMTLARRIEQLDAEITGKLTQRLQNATYGPWLLTCDAATNRGDPLVSVDAMNGAGECWHIRLCDSAEASQSGVFLKDRLLLLAAPNFNWVLVVMDSPLLP